MDALKHLSEVVLDLGRAKGLTVAERHELTLQLCKTMRDKVRSPGDLVKILGPEHQKQVARQILYQRYLEHWLVESPVRVWILLERSRGSDPTIRWVQPWPMNWP